MCDRERLVPFTKHTVEVTATLHIHDLRETLARRGDEFLVLDFNRLFVSSTLREEAWLLSQRDDPDLIQAVISSAAAFGISRVQPDRDLITYSGGEQAILAALLALITIRSKGLARRKVLLYNVLDSLSQGNRRRLIEMFAQDRESHQVALYANEGDQIVEVVG